MTTAPTKARLRAHVAALARDIGERHVFRPRALAAAADYIAGEWRAQGYMPERERFTVGGHECANLITVRPGRRLADRILLVGGPSKSTSGPRSLSGRCSPRTQEPNTPRYEIG